MSTIPGTKFQVGSQVYYNDNGVDDKGRVTAVKVKINPNNGNEEIVYDIEFLSGETGDFWGSQLTEI